MQQHPVPQNVTQYQFRLVGDMTLKQFLELMGGVLLAYLFYASNLIFLFKWPLAILSIFLGFALAFLPIEDRPLDQWIINLLHAIYKPTRFIWKKSNKIPSFFLFSPHSQENVNAVIKTIKAPVKLVPSAPIPDLSAVELAQLASVDALFSNSSPSSTIVKGVVNQSPTIVFDRPSVHIRKLRAPTSTPPPTIHAVSIPTSTPPTLAPVSTSTTPPITPTNTVIFTAPTIHADAPTVSINTIKTISLPAAPTLPNLVTGIVVDLGGKLVENAIVQIVDQGGVPARAIKTNSLGRFFTSTPLSPGTYTIEVDRSGLQFAPQQLVVNDAIIPPFELRASA
ncbi:MAG: PrgI family protein [bacterium]